MHNETFHTPASDERSASLSPTRRALLEKWRRGNTAGSPAVQRIPRRPPDEVIPLSFQQQRLWFLDQLEPGNAFYTSTLPLEMQGELRVDLLERSLNVLLDRHASLRTYFPVINGQPCQQIAPATPLCLQVFDLHDLPASTVQQTVQQTTLQAIQRPFHLATGPLLRACLLRRQPSTHLLLLVIHHTIVDGLSMYILRRELALIYTALLTASPLSLPALPLQYADYAAWQQEWMKSQEMEEQLRYWQRQLAGAPALLELPANHPRPAIQTYRGAVLRQKIAPDLADALTRWSKQEGVTLFMTMLAAFQILLARYSGQTDIVVGTPIANRTRSELEPLVGFFANTLALRADLSGRPAFREYLRQVRARALEAYAHQEMPFERLVEVLQPSRSLSHNPIFQVTFSLDELALSTFDMHGLEARISPPPNVVAQFDLSLSIFDTDQGLTFLIQYSTDLFEERTIARMARHYLNLLAAILRDPDQSIDKLPILSAQEREQLLEAWNARNTFFNERCIHEMFTERAQQTPDAVALLDGELHLTFGALNARANQVAWYLRALGMEPERLVALYLARSAEMLVGLLGVLKAGGAYLPLDPTYPAERLTYLLQDSQAEFILTLHVLPAELETGQAAVLNLAGAWSHIAGESSTVPQSGTVPSNLAYVIYTSGSTGQPKGVLIPHSALASHSMTAARRFALSPADRVLQFASLSFDVAAEEIFPTWLAGACLVLHSSQPPLPLRELSTLLWQQSLTVLNLPTSYWHLWTAELAETGQQLPATLRLLIVGSESASADQLEKWRAHAGRQINWCHAYGVTEATITSTLYELPATQASCEPELFGAGTTLPIGRPLENTRIYLLDANLQPVPVGVVGDLYLGGAALARGYHRRPQLSAERFLPDPFADKSGARLYKTGDRARYREDGTLEFMGRSDIQLNLRGYRIEPGEIEARLREHSDVQEAVLLACQTASGEQQLVAYVQPKGDGSCSERSLRDFLQRRLPSYMLPHRFCLLDAFPLIPGGKIDRSALTPPAGEEAGDIEPRTALEARLAEIWAELLKRERVSISANFFALGGHSLLATRLMARVRETFQIDLPLQRLFEAPTIAELAQVIAHHQEKNDGIDALALLPVLTSSPEERYQPFPMTEVLQAYWIGQNAAFELGNVSTHAYLEVQKDDLDLERFTQAWRRLIERHELLRTIILPQGQMQILREVEPYEIAVHDLRGQDQQAIEHHLDEVHQRMSHQILPTDRWPQFDLLVSRLDERRFLLHISLGPLTGDGTSWSILDRELAYLYANPRASLPPLEISYRDYVLAELALKHTAIYQRARDYWLKRLPELPSAPQLPLAQSPSALTTPRFVRRSLVLAKDNWGRVKERAAGRGLTPSSIVLAAFAGVLARWSKAPRFTINLTVFNRLPLHPQVNDLVGDFTSLTLLEVDESRVETFSEQARRIQQQLWEDLDHRYFDGVQVLRELARTQGNTLEARMPIVFTSTLGYQARESKTATFFSGNVSYSITQTPQVWIDNQVFETGEALVINWDAVEELFPPDLLDTMFDAYRTLLVRLANSAHTWDEQSLQLLPDRQIALLRDFNQTDAPLPEEVLYTRFLAQVRQRPDAPAVIAPQKTLSYGELYLRANQVARRLRAGGASPNTLVAIVMEKGWEQVVAALGIQIAGAAYLPIDAELPAERIMYLLQHGEVSLALTQSWLEKQIRWPPDVLYFSLDTLEPAPEEAEPLACIQQPADLAYVIYTSGSTGLPKGVMINHAGAVNTVLDMNERFGIGPADRVLALSALNFDLSVYDIFGMLAAGAGIVLPEANARQDPAHWAALLAHEQVTIWNTVPALLDILVEYLNNCSGALPPSLRLALLSGDWIPLALPDQVRKLAPLLRVISLGGATEASIWSILYPVERVERTWKSIPYGRPMRNQRFYVFNERLEACPTWVPGQLYIGGAGLALGYWHDEAKTASSFIWHPETGERLYRTGDLGRYLPDGTIEFLGREDFQVKIQGHRIELGEIEATLARLDGIQTAIVVARGPQQGNRRLVAYIVPRPGHTFEAGELRAFLQQKLPGYMVPSSFVLLESLPLTPNGKIDRNALPDPVDGSSPARSDARAGETGTDSSHVMTRLVTSILQLDQLDAEQNLFDLGANSIDILRILNLVEKELRFRPSLAEFLSQPSIDYLVTAYESWRRGGVPEAASPQANEAAPTFALLRDPIERETWKQQHLELRRDTGRQALIPLPAFETDEQLRARYLARRSQRRFTSHPLPFERMCALLGCLRRFSFEGEDRHLYPSAGALYPIQVYLHVKAGRVERLEAGIYYYHPVYHQLISLAPGVELEPDIHDPLINRPIFEEAAFSLFLIAQLSAIAPLYGSAARDFCLLEAGYMSQLLMQTAGSNQIGLCPIGSLDFARIEHFFALDEHQILIHSLLGGAESEEGEL